MIDIYQSYNVLRYRTILAYNAAAVSFNVKFWGKKVPLLFASAAFLGFLPLLGACDEHTPVVDALAQREYREAQVSEPLALLTEPVEQDLAKRAEGDRARRPEEAPESPPAPSPPSGGEPLPDPTRAFASGEETRTREHEHPATEGLLGSGKSQPIIFLNRDDADVGRLSRTNGEAVVSALGNGTVDSSFRYACDPEGECYRMSGAEAEPQQELRVSVGWNQERIPKVAYRVGRLVGNSRDDVFAVLSFNKDYPVSEGPPAWLDQDPPQDWRVYLFEPDFRDLKSPYRTVLQLERTKDGHELSMSLLSGEPWVEFELQEEAQQWGRGFANDQTIAVWASRGTPPALSGLVRTPEGVETWFIAVPDDEKLRMAFSDGIRP